MRNQKVFNDDQIREHVANAMIKANKLEQKQEDRAMARFLYQAVKTYMSQPSSKKVVHGVVSLAGGYFGAATAMVAGGRWGNRVLNGVVSKSSYSKEWSKHIDKLRQEPGHGLSGHELLQGDKDYTVDNVKQSLSYYVLKSLNPAVRQCTKEVAFKLVNSFRERCNLPVPQQPNLTHSLFSEHKRAADSKASGKAKVKHQEARATEPSLEEQRSSAQTAGELYNIL